MIYGRGGMQYRVTLRHEGHKKFGEVSITRQWALAGSMAGVTSLTEAVCLPLQPRLSVPRWP